MKNNSKSSRNASRRLNGRSAATRLSGKLRADSGHFRLPADVEQMLSQLLGGYARPKTRDILDKLHRFCTRRGYKVPSKATVYNYMKKSVVHQYDWDVLSPSVQCAMYNLDSSAVIPGHQAVFYALNYGDVAAISFAAGCPWIDLYQADKVPGWRPKSHALLKAIIADRKQYVKSQRLTLA